MKVVTTFSYKRIIIVCQTCSLAIVINNIGLTKSKRVLVLVS